MQHTGNPVWTSDATPRNGSTADHNGRAPDLVILSPEATAALQTLRERARKHDPAPEPVMQPAPKPMIVRPSRPLPPPTMPQPTVTTVQESAVARQSEPTAVAQPEYQTWYRQEYQPDDQDVESQPVDFDQAIAEARAEAAAAVAAARAQAVSLLADAVAEVRDERGAALPASLTVVLDPDTFARAFAVAIAAVLEQRPEAAAASAAPAAPAGASGRQIIDLGTDFIDPHQALQFQIQQAHAFQAAQQAASLWPTQASAPAKSFWSNAWHPDVLLSAVAMIIVLIVLVAFAA